MHRLAQSLLLLVFGATMLRTGLTDLHLRYVAEPLGPLLVVAGGTVLIAALVALRHDLDLADTRATVRVGPGSVGHQHGGDHGPAVAWLLVLPVLALTLLAPPALGAYRAERTGTMLHRSPGVSYPALPAEDPVTLTLYEFAYRASTDAGASLAGRRVRLIGFVATGPDGRLLLARIVVSCCAADGRPIKVGLTGQVPARLVPDTWIEVTGRRSTRIGTDPANDGPIPYLHVDGWQPVPAPRQPYE
ncbi:TIGR03943 family protein [Micromonospora sp. WMMA1363]|uniref:TIGR03943 family putative permease subunit n=1 Tax=Micromonospora sp. WMMA1363 TaxID=3053985 RepID=UPI00259CA420|nr:TIGR03943 family protein [Micromonospora sp. WMMA1363]MDM4721202.1 TIGR03943 family protein [Micromonospora sp. WMMA1363]